MIGRKQAIININTGQNVVDAAMAEIARLIATGNKARDGGGKKNRARNRIRNAGQSNSAWLYKNNKEGARQ